jgi:hypothetical protein
MQLHVTDAGTGDGPPICVTARGSRTRLPSSNDFSVSLSKDPDPEVDVGVGEPGEDGPNTDTTISSDPEGSCNTT